jgi:hypothetical protein
MPTIKLSTSSAPTEDELLQWFLEQGFAAVSHDEQQRFTMAIGRMVQVWTDLETSLHHCLRHYCGVSPKIARAIFSGTRARVMCDYLSNIAESIDIGAERKADFADLLPHIKAMNTMRDWIIHNASASEVVTSTRAETKRAISNKQRANRPDNAFTVMVDSALIETLNGDVIAACHRLHAHREKGTFKPAFDPGTGKVTVWRFVSPQKIRRASKKRET